TPVTERLHQIPRAWHLHAHRTDEHARQTFHDQPWIEVAEKAAVPTWIVAGARREERPEDVDWEPSQRRQQDFQPRMLSRGDPIQNSAGDQARGNAARAGESREQRRPGHAVAPSSSNERG